MHRSIHWLAIGALCVGGGAAIGCGDELVDGTGTGGSGTTSGKTSSSTMSSTNATSSNASTSTGGVGPCVLDSSKYDECILE